MMSHSRHPDPQTLEHFVLGRLDRRTMARVEGHLTDCMVCEQVATQVPDDRLVMLLRTATHDFTAEAFPREGLSCR
jgi:hypothetical protein